MPLHRTAFADTPRPPQQPADAPTCGHLFQAVQAFLQTPEGLAALSRGMADSLGEKADSGAIEGLDVMLVKHGEFYHPCRIEVRKGREPVCCLVLNVAVSRPGLAQLETEYHTLERLNRDLPLGFFPRVYGSGSVPAPFPMAMFLAQWLDGFCEFHASRSGGRGNPALVIWGPDDRDRILYGPPVLEIYRRAAAILAACYNPETFAHIQSWHHAAGDFVVRQHNNAVTVRLISARAYTPLFRSPPATDSQRLILEALLVFLLQLSVRMRIDRTDGVGDLIWVDGAIVPATIQGFFDGLKAGCRIRGIATETVKIFAAYLSSIDEADLLKLGRHLAQVHLSGEEKPLAQPGMAAHCARLHAALRFP